MNNAFELAEDQLREIASASDGTIEFYDVTTQITDYRLFEISVRFDGLDRTQDGLRVRARELFNILVPITFPFNYPRVNTPHTRFASFPHVQWGRVLCLYRSSADWDPKEGMYGFIRRLDAWIRDAARNNLDPTDLPLHPPVAYPTVNRLIVPRVNTPKIANETWFGVAELRIQNQRTEIIGWKKGDYKRQANFAPAILLHEKLPFEYPKTVRNLLKELGSHGVEYASFIFKLASYAQHSDAGTPLTVILGTPMRRINPGSHAIQHLAAWEISAFDADKLRELIMSIPCSNLTRRTSAINAVVEWSQSAKVGWCIVQEMRPEVTRRRDISTPMSWFRGRRIAIWGCGAVGTHVAESVVRAGASSVELVDNKKVVPGILVRQGFEDADIGKFKADALAERLKRIAPELETSVLYCDLIPGLISSNVFPNVDLVIDCTASLNFRTALEYALRKGDVIRPSIACLAIDSQAVAAIATLSMSNHSGCSLDLMRRLKLEACHNPTLTKVLEKFWPLVPPDEHFEPEPGCSEPTFIGSNADLAGLSARMLNSIARFLNLPNEDKTGAGWLLSEEGRIHTFTWSPDHVLMNEGDGYSVRVCQKAEREIRGWARRSVRTVGPKVETGGLVFGELHDAARVLWVTDVEGPPSDSRSGEDHFTCGTEGMKEASEEKQRRYRGAVEFIGSWHTHPTSVPYPSKVDILAVEKILTESGSTQRTCLILILAGDPDTPSLGAHVFRNDQSGNILTDVRQSTAATIQLGPQPKKSRDIGIALSGGGSRAIAFHLGCLRALHDLGLLNRVQVISSVSGGSIIAAMYAYSNESFREFDKRVVRLLRKGLYRDFLRQALTPNSIWKFLKVNFVSCACILLRTLQRFVYATVRPTVSPNLIPQPVRMFSRTEIFRDIIANSLFGETKVHDVSRESLHTVINATELKSGSAFRFGSKRSGCWRFGTIPPEDALVADAVAASAAYPVFLPALERKYCFKKNGKCMGSKHVLLTDGGVFENLGVSPMEPGRNPSISTNVFDPDYIICCDAGAGLFSAESHPVLWPSRMHRSFLSVFRKVQDATRKHLHYLNSDGKISGFALCYLGQQDNALPWIPAGLPRRNEVKDYPTNFAAMSAEDIDRLALRGELLMRFLVAYYLHHI